MFFLLLISRKSQLFFYMVTQIIEKILPRNVYVLNCGSFYVYDWRFKSPIGIAAPNVSIQISIFVEGIPGDSPVIFIQT